MRFLLAALAVSMFFALGWLWWGDGAASVGAVDGLGTASTASEPRVTEDNLVAVTERSAEPSQEVSRTAVPIASPKPKEKDTSLWPKGFSQLVVRVVAAKRPVAGVIVEVPDGADAQLIGVGDEQGRGITDGKGEVRFFVRPTRTVLLSAREPKTSRAVEGTYTTPFERRTRAVELILGTDEESGLAVLILTELGGTPLAGASIEVLGARMESTTEAFADATGLAYVPEERWLEYRISHAGFVTETFDLRALQRLAQDRERDEPVAVRLRPYAHVRGVFARTSPGIQSPETIDGSERPASTAQATRPQQKVVLRPTRDPESSTETTIQFGRTVRFDRSGASSSIGPDGEWSLMVAIPKDEPHWEQVSVGVTGPHETRRDLATIGILRPGDQITIEDPWAGLPGLRLAFHDAAGQPTLVGKRVRLSQHSIEAARHESTASGVVDRKGSIYFPRMPVGTWSYVVEVPGAPAIWSPSGTFRHAGSAEPVIVTFSGEPLIVKLPRRKEGPRRAFRLSVAEAGRRPDSSMGIKEGEKFAFPWVPPNTSWTLVLVPLRAGLPRNGTQRVPAELLGSLEVPIHPDDREIVLRPDGQ